MKTKPELQAELIEHLKEMLYLTGWPAGQPETTSKQLMDAISQLQEGECYPGDKYLEQVGIYDGEFHCIQSRLDAVEICEKYNFYCE